jgi:hypothetical protein
MLSFSESTAPHFSCGPISYETLTVSEAATVVCGVNLWLMACVCVCSNGATVTMTAMIQPVKRDDDTSSSDFTVCHDCDSGRLDTSPAPLTNIALLRWRLLHTLVQAQCTVSLK